ncbi:MAG: putative lipid II flippase FtsW [Clostridia bacterium]|nr:putative lipid II flippase FtsW [Clostridia bacterium]
MPKKEKLKSFKNNSFDFTLLIIIFILLALGIVMVLSASSPTSLSESGSSYTYAIKQGLFAILGIFIMLFLSKVDYRIYKKLYKVAYWASIIALALVPLIGYEVNGAKRWINLGFTSVQPSDLAKIGFIIFFAGYLSIHKDELKGLLKGFIKPFLILAPGLLILVLFQEHLSATLVIVAVITIMLLIAGTRLRYFLTLGLGGAGVLLTALIMLGEEFRLKRITTFLDPWQDKQGAGWQVIQSLYAIGSGGLFGVGLGESKQKYLYIPEPHNDFIFAVLAEELGFLGCLVVIVLFGLFVWRGVLIAMKAPDTFGSLLAVGITSLIGLQAILNIAVVTSSMPATGMALPFFSYGGTALVTILAACGILLNISRAGKKI